MRTVTVLNGQTFIDLAVQEYGTAEAAFDLAAYNNYSISDSGYLTPGETLSLPELSISNKEVYDYYTSHKITPKNM